MKVAAHPGLNRLSEGQDVHPLARGLEGTGWTVFLLPAGITSRPCLFHGIRAVLPLEPAVIRWQTWDTLSDSLWGGLDAFPARKIAILWQGSWRLRERAPDDFGVALGMFEDLCASLGGDVEADEEAKRIAVFL